jgi:hypothetical protein
MNSSSFLAACRWLCAVCVTASCIALFGCGGGSGGGSTTGGTGGGGTTPPTPTEILYVASGDNGQGQILAFPVSASGPLGASAAISTPQTDAASKFLYASDFDNGAMRVYSIQSSTGALNAIGDLPLH